MTIEQQNQIVRGLSASRFDCELTMLVRRSIVSSLASGRPTIAQAAEAADMSVRTLQRRLDGFGIRYSQLVEEVRLETACRMLERSETRLADAARALGYSDASHFARAFRRWTGETPSAFRHRFGQGRRHRS